MPHHPTDHISSGKDRHTLTGRAGFPLFVFFALYIAQSIPSSFLSTALQVLMRQAHFSLSAIGLLQLVKLPWILKFIWSPIVDRRCVTVSDFKRCIIGSELVYAAVLLIVGLLDIADNLYLILGLVVISLAASATQDIATDALAVLSFRKQDRSRVNSIQSAGNFGGVLVGGGLLLMVLHRYGWNVVLPSLALFVILAIVPLIFSRNITIRPKNMKQRARWADFVFFFGQRGIWRQTGFLLLYYSSIIGILSMIRPWLVDLGYTMKEIGLISGILGTGMAFAASFLCGAVIRRIGIGRTRLLVALLIFITTLAFVVLSFVRPSTFLVCAAISLLWFAYGSATVVVYTTSMNCVREGREGTDFTVQTVLTHLAGMGIAIVSGVVAHRLGYHGLFMAEAIIAAISILYTATVFKNRRRLKTSKS